VDVDATAGTKSVFGETRNAGSPVINKGTEFNVLG
jgi:hypothetical protein